MTELALARPAARAAGASSLAVPRARRRRRPTGSTSPPRSSPRPPRWRSPRLALRRAASRRSRWLKLDAASGVFVAVIAVVGLCSALVSPCLPAHGRAQLVHRRALAPRVLRRALRVLGRAAGGPDRRQPRRRLARGRGHDRRPRRCWSRFSGRREALEAGWKYLVLTTLGLSVALLGIVDPGDRAGGPGARRPARARLERARARRAGGRDADAPRLRADHRRPGDEDRLGARAQLAAGRAQRGAGADQRAALGRAAADGRARRLAGEAGARRGASARAPPARCSSASGWRRSSSPSRSCGGRCR